MLMQCYIVVAVLILLLLRSDRERFSFSCHLLAFHVPRLCVMPCSSSYDGRDPVGSPRQKTAEVSLEMFSITSSIDADGDFFSSSQSETSPLGTVIKAFERRGSEEESMPLRDRHFQSFSSIENIHHDERINHAQIQATTQNEFKFLVCRPI